MRAHEVGCSVGVGRSFPGSAVPEIASRNPAPKRNAVSQWRMLRKARPGIGARNGLHFLCRRRYGKCIPESASNAGHGFRLRHDRERYPVPGKSTARQSLSPPTKQNGRLGYLSEPPVWRAMSRHLARYVIPDHVVAIGENVVTARRHGRHTVNGVHPTARGAMLLLGQTANGGNICAIR